MCHSVAEDISSELILKRAGCGRPAGAAVHDAPDCGSKPLVESR